MENTEKIIKLLFIGNSFSDDASFFVPDMLFSLGYKKENVVVANAYIGGCSLNTHKYNAENDTPAYDFRVNENGVWNMQYGDKKQTLKFAVEFKEWDYISFQQASIFSGKKETYNEDLEYLLSYVKGLAENKAVKYLWHMTWAYQNGFTDLVNYDNDQNLMYNSIIGAVKEKIAGDKRFLRIIPSGTAVQNAREYLGDTLNLDGTHLSIPFGRYLSALTVTGTVLGVSPKEIPFIYDGLIKDKEVIAKKCALNAILSPFVVSEKE